MCEDFDIKSLPYDFVPNTKPSKVIQRLIEKRRKNHNETIEKMGMDMKNVNEDIDKVVSHKAKQLQETIDDIKTKTEVSFSGLRNMQEDQFSLEDHALTDGRADIEKAKYTFRDLINEFSQFLNKCEEDRIDRMKKILNVAYTKLGNIAYESPHKLSNFIEYEILELNKLLLNNRQNISELEKHMKLQVEYIIKEWNEEMLEIKEVLKKFLKALTRMNLLKRRSNVLTPVEITRSREIKEQITNVEQLHSELKLYSSLESLVPVTFEDIESWLKKTQLILANLDESAKNLVNSYKSIIIILFNRFFDELEDLKKTILATGIVEKKELKDFQGEIYTPPVEDLKIKSTQDLVKIQSVWGEAIEKMKVGVNETYTFLRMAAGLWERHFVRVKDAQVIVERDIENTAAKNNHFAQINEIKVNILLDKLRQCPAEKKLEKLLDETKLLLVQIENNYAADYASEIQVAEKYHSIIENELEVLMAEIRRYLTVYPRDDDKDPKKQRKRASQDSYKEIDPNEKLIPVNLIYCIFQVDAVRNWKFGLWEAINNYLETGKSEILAEADKWIGRQKEKIQERYDVKLAIHKPRFFGIVCSIYNKRVRELHLHSTRFIEHKKAVDIELKNLFDTCDLDRRKYKEIVSEFEKSSELFCKAIMQSNKSYQIRGHLNVFSSVEKHRQVLLKEVAEKSEIEGQALLDRLLTSNLLILKTIRYFSELGNFTVEDATECQKNVQRLDESIQKDVRNFNKLVQQDHQTFTTLIENKYSEDATNASHAIKELTFNESSVKDIILCQNNLKNEVISLKTKFQSFDCSIKKMMKESNENLDNDDYLTSLTDGINSTVDTLKEVTAFLEYRKIINLTSSNRVKANKTSLSNLEYGKSVSSIAPVENNLISNFNWILLHSYKLTRSKAKEFYTKHTPFFMNEEVIHHSFDKFMREILQNYNRLVNQCEEFWLESCKGLLAMLANFQKFIKGFLRNYENTFYEKGLEQSKNAFEDILADLNKQKTETQDEIKSMYKKLKALHGHPRNKMLLSELEQESNNLATKYKDQFVNILQPYKERLVAANNTLIERFNIVRPKIESLYQSTILSDLIETIKSETIMKVDMPESTVSLVEHDVSLQKSISRQLLQSSNTETAFTITADNTTASSMITNDSSESYFDFPKQIEINFEINLKKISDFIDVHLTASIANFNEVWANEIKNVINLYKLRYS